MSMTPQQYRSLVSSSILAPDADTQSPNVAQLFTPATHRNALDPDVTLVVGGRGAGKTVWFKALQSTEHRELAASAYQLPKLSQAKVAAGHGAEFVAGSYPGPGMLKQLLALNCDPELIWQSVCLHALGKELPGQADDWPDRVRFLAEHPSYFETEIEVIDKSSNDNRLILFDALDRMSGSVAATEKLVGGLFRVVLDLRTRTRSIRGKVFARPDFVEDQSRFPDASKLFANKAELAWDASALYGLLFTLLGNSASPIAQDFRNDSGGQWNELAPGAWRNEWLAGDGKLQKELFFLIAGLHMGTNHRRGITYRWLPSHLADGKRQTSPRSFLAAIRVAAEETAKNRADYQYALHFDAIKAGVQKASAIRAHEVVEDMPWVSKALEALAPMAVPATEEDIYSKWKADLQTDLLVAATPDDSDVRMGPRNAADHGSLIADLERLGMMTRRADRRVDVPDVYRIAFGLGRKGGVPRSDAR
jgi:hypothetical protein